LVEKAMRRGEKFASPVSILLLFLLLASCAVNPVTGKRELMLVSEKGEIALGEETDGEIRAQFGVYDDPNLQAYVERVGKALVPHTHRPHLAYHFAVLDTPVVNAFAVPGGYVYVTRGILALMNSEAELAVVLGHELAHVNARHSLRKMSQLMLVQLGLYAAGAISETLAKLSGAAGIGIQLLFLKFSRDDERQADALGVEYSRKGGYNPGEMVRFFVSLEKLGDLSEGHSLPGFLSTHPLTSERIEKARAMLGPSDSALKTDEASYMRSIRNMVFGEDPRQGYIEEGVFYHPVLRFSFTVPQGWDLRNTPSRVVMGSEDGNAALVLQAEESTEDLPAYAEKKASGLEGSTFRREQRFTVNRLNAYRREYEIVQEDKETLRLEMSFIRKEGFIYTFSALSTRSDFGRYSPDFRSAVRSFRELRDPAYINRKPRRIRLVRAGGKETLKDIFRKAGMEEELWTKMAVMNGLEPDAVPEAGRLVKTVR